MTEAELNAPDLDDDGNLDVEHYPVPDGVSVEDPYLRAVWDAAVRGLSTVEDMALSTTVAKPEEETETAELFGQPEVGSIGSATLDTAREPRSTKVNRENRKAKPAAKGRRRALPKHLRAKKKWFASAAMSSDSDGGHLALDGCWLMVAEVLVTLLGDGALSAVMSLLPPGGAAFALPFPRPRGWYRSANAPRPGWVNVYTTPRGTKWWASPKNAAAGVPAVPAAGAVPAAPTPPTPAPAQPPSPTQAPATPSPPPVPSAILAAMTPSAAHAAAMARLATGAPLTYQEKVAIATHLPSMGRTELKQLHAALGAGGVSGVKQHIVNRVHMVLTGHAVGAIPLPTPAPASAPTPTLPTRQPSNAAYSAVKSRIASSHQLSSAEIATVTLLVPHLTRVEMISLYSLLGGSGGMSPSRSAMEVQVLQQLQVYVAAKQTAPAPAPPTPAPAAPPPKPTAAGPHYQPPPPNLAAKVGPYAKKVLKGAGAKSAGMPPTIDHTVVGSYPKTLASLQQLYGSDFTDNSPPTNSTVGQYGARFKQISHGPSGYQVVASWKHSAPSATGGSADYRIDVLDGTGKVVSTYDNQAPRSESYVEERAVQVAHWLEGEVKRLAVQKKKQGAPVSAPLAQFAWDYAQAAGVQPGKAPFAAGDTGPAARAAVEGYLRAAFPKLVGAVQHAPHGGMDVVEHTMNIVDPANLRVAGLPQRDAELLRLGMVFHDVGKQHDPLDHEHPRKSAVDAEPLLWQFGLTPKEVSDTLAVIKWHDAYGDAMKAGGGIGQAQKVAKLCYEYADSSLSDADRKREALRINNLLMRAWQSDLSTIPGLTAKPIPGRPDLTPTGFIDVDAEGPVFEDKVEREIRAMGSSGVLPKSLPLPKKSGAALAGAPKPDLVASGLKWGELVQRADDLPVGEPVPYDSTVAPPQEVYDEARNNPELNYARAFNMGYDGPTGMVVTGYHGAPQSNHRSKDVPAAILSTGLRPGNNSDNAFGHGVYMFVNGADKMTRNYSSENVVTLEVHTGRVISYEDLISNVMPKWKKANPQLERDIGNDYKASGINAAYTAAALWAGYSTIAKSYYSGEPVLVVLDPARVRIKSVVGSRSSGYNGKTVNTPSGPVSFQALTKEEKSTPKGNPNHMPTKGGTPQGWSGAPRTS